MVRQLMLTLLIIFALICGLLTGILVPPVVVVRGIRDLSRSVQAKLFWQTTTGTLVKARLEEGRSAEGVTYYIRVRYRYTVNGIHYEGTNWSPFSETSWYGGYSRMKALLWKLQNQKPLRVYFNPSNPAESALTIELEWSVFTLTMGSAGFLIFTLPLLFGGTMWLLGVFYPRGIVLKWHGVRDEGDRILLSCSRWRGVTRSFAAGIGFVIFVFVFGFPQTFIDIPISEDSWLWLILPLPFVIVAVWVHDSLRPKRYLLFDGLERVVAEMAKGQWQIKAHFGEIGAIRLTGQKPEDSGSIAKVSIELLRAETADEHTEPVLTCEVTGMPDPIVKRLSQRLTELFGVELREENQV